MMLAAILNGLLGLAGAALVAMVLWPRAGLLARGRAAHQLAERSRREDALKHMLHAEANGRTPTLASLAGALQLKTSKVAALLEEMEDRGLVSYTMGHLRLEPAGRELALHVIRAHRLWESYLADQTGVAESDWHHQAELQEHLLSPQQANELAAHLGHPMRDPHGDAIPEAGGELPADAGQSLNAAPLDQPLMIAHIEDEPETIYAQLAALGLRPGMKVSILEKSAQRIRFRADTHEHVLAPVLADNISVAPLPETNGVDLREDERLSALPPGQQARVLGLAAVCRGPERRRLLDLGFVPGTMVSVEMISPAGDPTAYRVRGTTIALRAEQANLIRISREESLAV
jgi:DtxR family Mn-dependent transcriptional regulator